MSAAVSYTEDEPFLVSSASIVLFQGIFYLLFVLIFSQPIPLKGAPVASQCFTVSCTCVNQ